MCCTHSLKVFNWRDALRTSLVLFCWIVISSLSAQSHNAWGRAFRLSQLPNSARLQCTVCHLDPLGGPVNAFGLDAQSTFQGGSGAWPRRCPLDSDGDGWRNGEELGDARCRWRVGLAEPRFPPSDPSDPSVTPETISQPPADQGSRLDLALDQAQIMNDLRVRGDQQQLPPPDQETSAADRVMREQGVNAQQELDRSLDMQISEQDQRAPSPDQRIDRREQAELMAPERSSGCHFMASTPLHPLIIAFFAFILSNRKGNRRRP